MLITVASYISANAQGAYCGVRNNTFSSGEKVTMKVYYSTMGAYVGAGEATFTTNIVSANGRKFYHCVGVGKTYSFFDNFFKVRDRYESYLDTATLRPYKFVRNIEEGSYKKSQVVSFDQVNNVAISDAKTYSVPNCIQDVVSAVYYARNIDYSKYKPGDKIFMDMFLDDQVYHLYIRYMGKVNIKTRYGKFEAFKIKPLLVKGTIFQGGEEMNAYFSNDNNRLLLRVESPITVGKIVVDMMGYSGLRYPLTSLKSI